MPNTISYILEWQAYNGMIQTLDITDRVIKDTYPLDVRMAAGDDYNIEGTLKVIDKDGVIEKILLGLQNGPSFGAVKLKILRNYDPDREFWTTGRYTRKLEVLEIEYEKQRKARIKQNTTYNVADLNRVLADIYGISTTGPAVAFSHSTYDNLRFYAGAEIPSDLQPWEITWARSGVKVFVLLRNVLLKFDTTTEPWKLEAMVDIRNFCDSTDQTSTDAIVDGAVYSPGICGQIMGITSGTLQIMTNACQIRTNNTPQINCYRIFNVSASTLSLSSKSGFFIKEEDLQGNTDVTYNWLASLPDGRQVFLFKGIPNGTLVLSNGSSIYQVALIVYPSNTVTTLKPAAFYVSRGTYYDLYILGGPRHFRLQIYNTGPGGTSLSQNDIVTAESTAWATGYLDTQTQIIHFTAYRKGITEKVQHYTVATTGLNLQLQRTIEPSGGEFKGMGYDSGYKLVEALFTYDQSGQRITKVYRTTQNGTTADRQLMVYLSNANLNRGEDTWIYYNPAARTGGLGKIASSGNIYLADYDEALLQICPAGFINSYQFLNWDNSPDSGIFLKKSDYEFMADEKREIDAHKRYIIQTIDGETIPETTAWWSGSDEIVSLPVTGEMARTLLAKRRSWARLKTYTVRSYSDITSALGMKIQFENPEGNIETGVLTSYTFNTDGKFEYQIVVYQSDVDVEWPGNQDQISWIVIDCNLAASWQRTPIGFVIRAKLSYRSLGYETPTYCDIKVFEADTGQLVSHTGAAVRASGVLYTTINVTTLKPQYLFVYTFRGMYHTKQVQITAEMENVTQPKQTTTTEIDVIATEGVIDNINPFFFQEDYGWVLNNFSLQWNYLGRGWVAVADSGTTASIKTAQKLFIRTNGPYSETRNAKKVIKVAGFSTGQSIKISARVILCSEEDFCLGVVEYDLGSYAFLNTTFIKPIEVPLIYDGAVVCYYTLELVFEGNFDEYPLVIRAVAITSGISKHNIIEGFKFSELLDGPGSLSGHSGKIVKVNNDGTGLELVSPDQFISPTPAVPGDTSYWIAGLLNATTLTTRTIIGGSRTYWWPFVVTRKTTIQSVAINITASATATVSIGVYNSTEQGYPNVLLQSANLSYSTESGIKTASFNIVLNPGLYWMALRSSAAVSVSAIPVGACMAMRTPTLGTASVTDYYTSDSSLPAQAPSSGYTAETGQPVPAVGFIIQ